MQAETAFTNARIVLADSVVRGSVMIRDAVIGDISTTAMASGEDLGGDYLLPGLIELHTDNLEAQHLPRPGVEWPAIPALIAHDALIAAAGITTVLDALRAGSFEPGTSATGSKRLADALADAKRCGLLRADHLIHLRCELPCPDTAEIAEAFAGDPNLRLMSVMDHTPGERQFVTIEKFREYYLAKRIMAPDQLEAFIGDRQELRDSHSSRNRIAIVALARRLALRLASHDDATPEHVDEAIAEGVTIAEFPTTADAAAAAHEAGLKVLMGAPNLVRGGSHSGNISTLEVAANGHLDLMSSDYVPASLLAAAFALPKAVPGIALPAAIATVTRNPAVAVGLDDRGEIALGKRADLIQVNVDHGFPLVRRVWREGRRVL